MTPNALRSALADRLTLLLNRTPIAEREGQMLAVLSILENAGVDLDPESRKPREFSREVFESPALEHLMLLAVEREFNPLSVESPEELALNLTP